MVFSFTDASIEEPVYISVRPASTAISIGDDGLSFDGAGRLLTASYNGHLYRRGLNHRIVDRLRITGVRRSRDLTPDESDALIRQVGETLQRLMSLLPTDAPVPVADRLDDAAGWDEEAYREDRNRYYHIYKPIGILPPDQYMALVLQATEGCHYNRCTFCHFYREIPFKIKDETEFRRHIDLAGRFVGKGLRRTLFLADANALIIPQPQLLHFFDTINDVFTVAPPGLSSRALVRWKTEFPEGIRGIYSFMDAFTGTKKTVNELADLAERGLRRIYIGMESGHIPLLQYLRKPSKPDDVLALVQTARTAGILVGIIVMVGIGGQNYADGHVADTISALNRLDLAPADLLYFSQYKEIRDTVDRPSREDERCRPLSQVETRKQIKTIRAGLRPKGGPKISIYDLDEFIY